MLSHAAHRGLLVHAQEGTAVDGDFAALSAREMLTKDTDELKRTVADRRERASERDRAMRDEGAGNAADRSAHAGIGNAAGNGGGGAAPGLAAARDGDGMPQEIPSSQVRSHIDAAATHPGKESRVPNPRAPRGGRHLRIIPFACSRLCLMWGRC